jgi:hypothetical protein
MVVSYATALFATSHPGGQGTGLNRELFSKTPAAFQLAFLAILFGLPLITSGSGHLLSEESLNTLLAFEFGVLMFGWLLASLFLVPIAVVDSVWLRRTCLLIAALLAILPFAARSARESGQRHTRAMFLISR